MILIKAPGRAGADSGSIETAMERIVMSPLLQWPVLLFAGMVLVFTLVMLFVSIGDARR